MTPAILAVVLWCAPVDSPFTILVKEKYGPIQIFDDVNCVVIRDGAYYVLRQGKLRGHYSVANYSVSRKD